MLVKIINYGSAVYDDISCDVAVYIGHAFVDVSMLHYLEVE